MKIQLVLSADQDKVLNAIMKQCGISTKTLCIGTSLGLLQWAVAQSAEGRKVISQKDGERDRELAFPWIVVQK